MIVTASTVKDTAPHVRRFVEGNLAGGVDHMVVFLDAPDDEVEAYLGGHPHVTHVVTDESWWRGHRPPDLNVRQRVNANLVKALMTRCGWAEWVFHIDGDEIAWIDRDVLARVPPGREAVRLAPLEAVAQVRWDGDPTWFKRLLDDDELAGLVAAGVITEPRNARYFHGHPYGKSGLRPRLDRWLTLHDVVDAERRTVPAVERPRRLRLLHYESFSGEEFVRKWSALLSSGTVPGFRSVRRRTAERIRAVLDLELPRPESEKRLMAIFAETIEDDLPLLRDRGLLVEADPSTWTQQPRALPEGEPQRLAALLHRVRREPKRIFHPGGSVSEIERVLDRLEPGGSRWWRR